MSLLYVLAALIVVFFALWYFAPSGWMTNIKTTLLGGLAAMPGLIETLQVGVDWREIMTPQNAAIVAGVLAVMGFLARKRSSFKKS